MRGALERGVSLSKGDSPRQRPRAAANGMAVIAALHDPLPVLATDDFADVVTPYDNRPDGGSICACAVVSPSSREIVLRSGIMADLCPHVPAAPRSGPPGIRVMRMVPNTVGRVPVMMIMMMCSRFCV